MSVATPLRFEGCDGPATSVRKGGVQAEKQQLFVRLIAQGISNSEACRIVGIDRKTGTRWRYGRTVGNHVGELATIRR